MANYQKTFTLPGSYADILKTGEYSARLGNRKKLVVKITKRLKKKPELDPLYAVFCDWPEGQKYPSTSKMNPTDTIRN